MAARTQGSFAADSADVSNGSSEPRQAMLQKCHTGSLAVILSSLTRASGSSQRLQHVCSGLEPSLLTIASALCRSQGQMCRDLLRHVANEMLQRRLSPRCLILGLSSRYQLYIYIYIHAHISFLSIYLSICLYIYIYIYIYIWSTPPP